MKMNSYLNKLANDQIFSDDDFVDFLNTYVNNKEALIELIDSLKSKLKLENIHQYFEKMKIYFKTYEIKRSDILKTSHVFCTCGIYTEAPLCNWVQKNPELFETEISFFDSLFSFYDKFGINIDNDVSSFPIDKLHKHEETLDGQTLNDEQTFDEKMKLLNTIVTNYKYIYKMLDHY